MAAPRTSRARAWPIPSPPFSPSPCACAIPSAAWKTQCLLEKAVERVLAEGYRTGDIMQPGMNKVGTEAMTDAILKALAKLSA